MSRILTRAYRSVNLVQNAPRFLCDRLSLIPFLSFLRLPIEFARASSKVIQFVQWNRAGRDIWMDGRKLPSDESTTWYGYSVGKWDGDTFVVDYTGFDDRTWVDHFGYPHSDQMHLQERYRRVNRDHLELTMTLTEPKTYMRSWESQKKVFTFQSPGFKTVPNGGRTWVYEDVCASM